MAHLYTYTLSFTPRPCWAEGSWRRWCHDTNNSSFSLELAGQEARPCLKKNICRPGWQRGNLREEQTSRTLQLSCLTSHTIQEDLTTNPSSQLSRSPQRIQAFLSICSCRNCAQEQTTGTVYIPTTETCCHGSQNATFSSCGFCYRTPPVGDALSSSTSLELSEYCISW